MTDSARVYCVIVGPPSSGHDFVGMGFEVRGKDCLSALARLHAIAPGATLYAVEIRDDLRYERVEWTWAPPPTTRMLKRAARSAKVQKP